MDMCFKTYYSHPSAYETRNQYNFFLSIKVATKI